MPDGKAGKNQNILHCRLQIVSSSLLQISYIYNKLLKQRTPVLRYVRKERVYPALRDNERKGKKWWQFLEL